MRFMDLFRYLYESRLSDLFTDLRYKLLISSTPVSSVNETGVTNKFFDFMTFEIKETEEGVASYVFSKQLYIYKKTIPHL